MPNASASSPPGWYPDPSGDQGWRLWNGAIWTELTRPYSSRPPVTILQSITNAQSSRRVALLASPLTWGAVGLGYSVLRSGPLSTLGALLLSIAAGALLVGTVITGFDGQRQESSRDWWSWIPVVNLYAASLRAARALDTDIRAMRLWDTILLVIYLYDTQVIVVPALLALRESSFLLAYADRELPTRRASGVSLAE